MEANDITLQALINAPKQYIIPVFQRYYSWTKDDWETLWSDIQVLVEPGHQTRTHFMGSLVFFPIPPSFSKNPAYQVIDGQQRLVTFSLILSALRYLATQYDQELMAAEIEENFLVHRFKKGEERFRIYPRQRDRGEYLEAITTPNLDIDGNIGDAFRYFANELKEFVEPSPAEKLQEIFALIKARLEFVYIQLDGENPYEIFKSLNSKGVPLSEADLIRNFVFMHVSPTVQDAFDDNHWRPLEAHFEYKAGEHEGELDSALATKFFRDHLMKSGNYIPNNVVFETFEKQFGTEFDPFAAAVRLQQDARFYDMIRGQHLYPDKDVDASLAKLRKLESTTTYPLLLALMQKVSEGLITIFQLSKAIELVSGFILRRYATNQSSRPYGRWFAAACGELGDKPVENLNRFLFEKGYPNDRQFQAAFSTFPWYVRSYTDVVLEALERDYGHKEQVDLSRASIEHIMPQTLTSPWRDMLGDNADEIHEQRLHTIGNLTLSAYNPELFNHPFPVKLQEYARSKITLNLELLKYDIWGEDQIMARATELAARASKIWIGPDEVIPQPEVSHSNHTTSLNENGLTPTRQLQLDFWTAYSEYLKAQSSKINPRKPYAQHWADFAIGRWEFWLGNAILVADKRTDVYLGMQGPDAKKHFQDLLNDRESIEGELGVTLKWNELPKKKSSYIYLSTDEFDPANRDQWPRQHAWMHRWLEAFFDCFKPRIKAMRH